MRIVGAHLQLEEAKETTEMRRGIDEVEVEMTEITTDETMIGQDVEE